MIESAIIALREGIEIALVIGIVLAYLHKIGKPALIRAVYWGLAAASLASIAGAIVLQRLGIDSESLEGYFLLFAAVFVGSMVIWMWMTAKHIRHEIEAKVGGILSGSSSRSAAFGMFSFTFLMIVREGMETVIFLQAVALSAGAWRSILGTAVGLTGAVLFGFLFLRGSLKIDIGRFLKVTACALIVFTLQLLVNAVHEFIENGILPASPKLMGILGPIVQNDALFIGAIVCIPAFMLMIPGRSAAPHSKPQRRFQMTAGFAALGITLFLGVGDMFSWNTSMDLTAHPIAPSPGGAIVIPLASVSDGKLHRYAVKDSDLTIRFFILKTGAATYATAFDACKACYSYGRYYLKKGSLICSQCDAPFPIAVLKPSFDESAAPDPNAEPNAMAGNGCHPIYLPSRIESGNVIVTLKDLQAQRQYFDIGEEGKTP